MNTPTVPSRKMARRTSLHYKQVQPIHIVANVTAIVVSLAILFGNLYYNFNQQKMDDVSIEALRREEPPLQQQQQQQQPVTQSSMTSTGKASQATDYTTTTTSADPSLPQHYTCLNRYYHSYAPASNDTIVSLANRQTFVTGGYEQIAKGSGNMFLAGPLLQTLSHVQHAHQIYGAVGEVGVHHGRFTGFLFSTATQGEPLVAVDLFETFQDQNVDLSGLGSYKRFTQGLASYGLRPTKKKSSSKNQDGVQVLTSSTTAFSPETWVEQTFANNPVGLRLWSVDAGHTTDLTRHDLRLALCNLVQGGIVILDDWFHAHWPGVVEGFYQFANLDRVQVVQSNKEEVETKKNGPGVYPFLLCEGKMYMTNDLDAHALYLETILNDKDMKSWASPYAREGHGARRERKWAYQMLDGTHYLRCDNRTAFPTVPEAQQVWLERLNMDWNAETTPKSSTTTKSKSNEKKKHKAALK